MSNLNEYLRFVVTLTAVVDPFLAVPFFLTVTASRSEAESRRLAQVVALSVFLVLAVAAWIALCLGVQFLVTWMVGRRT